MVFGYLQVAAAHLIRRAAGRKLAMDKKMVSCHSYGCGLTTKQMVEQTLLAWGRCAGKRISLQSVRTVLINTQMACNGQE